MRRARPASTPTLILATIALVFSLRPPVLLGQPDREPAVARPTRLACVGDSITFGHLIPNREHDSYPAQLAALLGVGWRVENFGLSGATALRRSPKPYDRQKVCRDALAFEPDVVVICLGTNETKREIWEAAGSQFAADYLALIQSFQKLASHPRVFLCRPIPLFRDRGKEWDTDAVLRDQILPRIEEVARSAKLPVIDLYAPFAAHPELLSDGVHPNASGAGLIARVVGAALTGRSEKTGSP